MKKTILLLCFILSAFLSNINAAVPNPRFVGPVSPCFGDTIVYKVLNSVTNLKYSINYGYVWEVPATATIIGANNRDSVVIVLGNTIGSFDLYITLNSGIETLRAKKNFQIKSEYTSPCIVNSDTNSYNLNNCIYGWSLATTLYWYNDTADVNAVENPVNPSVLGLGLHTFFLKYSCHGKSLSATINVIPLDDLKYVELNTNKDFKIFPNPSNGIFNIFLEKFKSKEVQFIVKNISGVEVFNQIVSHYADNYELSLKHCPPGVYFISFVYNLQIMGTQQIEIY